MNEFKSYKFGFMDHSHGGKKEAFYTSLLALGNGISMIEKHFTLDRKKKLKITSQDFQKINLNIL